MRSAGSLSTVLAAAALTADCYYHDTRRARPTATCFMQPDESPKAVKTTDPDKKRWASNGKKKRSHEAKKKRGGREDAPQDDEEPEE